MSKKILILSASPRIKGNSDVLCDQFMKGAVSSGHIVEKIYICKQDIKYCTGCMSCSKTSKCIIKDDMESLLEKMVEADVVVMATPVYFYNMNGQLKTFIDRCCTRYTELGNKDYYIIMSAAEDDKIIMNHVLESFDGFFDCLTNINKAGVIYGLGVNNVNDVLELPIMEEAYLAGKSA